MYKSFSINNFRGLKTLSLKNCKLVNLITGKNNTGKTALLESLFLHIGSMNPQLPLNLATFRGFPGFRLNAESMWAPLFNNFNTDDTIDLVAEYPDRTKASLSISLVPSSLVSLDKKEHEGSEPYQLPEQISLIPEKYLQYNYTHKGKSTKRIIRMTPQGFDIQPVIEENPFPGYFLPARHRVDSGGYAERLGNLKVKRLDYLVLDALRILEPNIKSLSTIPVGPISLVHIDLGGPRLLPIQLAGEGMSRIAEMVIDMVSAPKGIVLVDEIDAGIHYTVLPNLWEMMFYLTNKFKIQLFATTHSSDCLEAAYQALSNMKGNDMNIYRIQRIKDSISVVSYDKKQFKTVIDTGLEVR